MKGMSLKRKVFAIFIAALLLLTLIFFVGADLFIDEIILKVEKAHIKVDAERVYSFVERETETLEMYAEDWAVWDDTYNFVVNGNENYIRSNLLYNTFKILSVNYILILDRSGNVIFSRGYNLKNGREIGVPEELVRFAAQSGDRGLKGIVKTSDNITVAAVEPVLKSDGSGPSVGVFVLGRIFDEGYIKNISDTLGIKISKAETENRITELKEALYLKNGQPLWIKTISPKKSEGYFALKDVLGNDALLLKMDFIRHANIAFLSLRRFFVAFLIFSISAYCISTLLWFEGLFFHAFYAYLCY
ncbi:MAG: Diguanylate cyclase and metal dependent phosphohydrolase [Clostridia bacterium 41_269]|nr:MAG: Diguanylate cyclase and metal dependent phosphohydrolase [Clostridia bacterium 41_269]